MREEQILALTDGALKELWSVPQVSLTDKGKRFVRQYLMHQLVEPVDYIPWPKGCLLTGLVQAGMYREVMSYFELWIKKGAKLYTVDDLLAGQALLLLVEICDRNRGQEGSDAPYSRRQLHRLEMALHAMMGFLYAHAKDGQGSLPYRPLHKTDHIYADGIGMVCPFAIGYGVRYRDKEAVKLSMRQFKNFVENGVDRESGLPRHAYRYRGGEEPERFGARDWGRAAGWILYGMGMSLRFFDRDPSLFSEEREELLGMTERLADAVIRCQRDDGLFGSGLCDPASPADTSATAMILHGLSVLGGEAYGTAYRKALEALQKYCRGGKVLQAQSECISLGEYGERYGSFPWSVGMTLSLLVLS